MSEAFFWGAVGGGALVLGAVIALTFSIDRRVLGVVMAFGAGVLISAVAFDLVEEAFETSAGDGGVTAGLFAGALVFFAGDAVIDRFGGERPQELRAASRPRAAGWRSCSAPSSTASPSRSCSASACSPATA